MYKQASQLKLRFATKVGQLTSEQLWDLTLQQLSIEIKSAKKQIIKSDDNELSFLEEGAKIDYVSQLKFDILKDVYLTKQQDANKAFKELEIKRHNNKIDALIAEKKEDNLRNMSIDDLEKMRM